MKNVLVTGADGFIGSHLVEILVKKGCKVRALSQYNSFNNWGWLEDIPCLDQVEVITGDVRDPFFRERMTKGIDTIFHLAALIAIPYSYEAPNSYVSTNIQGTVNICQAAIKNNVQRVVHTSTSEVYGTALYVPIDEKHPLQPQSPYSASKISADMMAMSYFNSFDLPLTVVRPFNTYGPRQSNRAVIPTIISQVASGKKTIMLGDLTPTRDFNFVKDTCRGFIALAESDKTIGKTINVGSNYEISIGDTVKMIGEVMGADITVEQDPQRIRPQKSEVQRLWCDNSLIKELTGFEPQFSIRDGLKETADWFIKEENLRKYKVDIYNV